MRVIRGILRFRWFSLVGLGSLLLAPPAGANLPCPFGASTNCCYEADDCDMPPSGTATTYYSCGYVNPFTGDSVPCCNVSGSNVFGWPPGLGSCYWQEYYSGGGSSSSSSSGPTGTCIATNLSAPVAVRAARRGEDPTDFGTGKGPVCTPVQSEWATAFDTGDPAESMGPWTDPVNNMTNVHAIGTSAVPRGRMTGVSAAHRYPLASYAQSYDPTSPVVALIQAYPNSNNENPIATKKTTFLRIPQVAPVDVIQDGAVLANAPKTWPMRVVTGPLMSPTTNVPNTLAAMDAGWTRLPGAALAPCLCGPGTGAGAACDTAHNVVPPPNSAVLTVEGDGADITYGGQPDSKTPYLVINDSTTKPWGILRGRVVIKGTSTGINAIPVEIVSKSGQFSTVEKITRNNSAGAPGYFEILVDGDLGSYDLNINSKFPAASNPVTSYQHFYDPRYVSFHQDRSDGTWDITSPQTTEYRDLSSIPLALKDLTDASSSSKATVSGKVIFAETLANASGVKVVVIGIDGSVITEGVTDGAGNYSITKVPAGYIYTVRPVSDRTWSVSPLRRQLDLTGDPDMAITGQDFSVRGVPATVTFSGDKCQPGKLIVVSDNQITGSVASMMIDNRSAGSKNIHVGTVGRDGRLVFKLPHGTTYRAAAWMRQEDGSYTKTHLSGGDQTFEAGVNTYSFNCP